MSALKTLWKFSRPHTIIGSTISIVTLFVMACEHSTHADVMTHLPLLFFSLVTGIGCNIFIVGINQIEDIEIDKINKPYLPLASGELSVTNAYRIIYTAMFVSIVCAAYVSFIILGVVIISLLIGMAYSLPPLYLKRHHLPAAMAISAVRGLLVNLGGFYVFTEVIYGKGYISNEVYSLSIFIAAFSIAIAWFKDLPDMTGDKRHHIKTLAIVYSPKTAFYAGTLLVVLAYFSGYIILSDSFRQWSIIMVNNLLLIIFLVNAFLVDLKSDESVKRFYKRFWLFFFAEYLLYLFAFL